MRRDTKGANLFVSVLACVLLWGRVADQGSTGGSAPPSTRTATSVQSDHLGGIMQERNLLEDLVAVSPGMEIWWDSSPVIFGNWCQKMLAKADAGDQEVLKRQFARMYDIGRPLEPAVPRRHHQPAPLAGGLQGRPAALAGSRREDPRGERRASTPRASSGCCTKRSSSAAPTCSCRSSRRRATRRASSPARSTRAARSTPTPCWRRPSRSTPSTPT